MKKHFPLTFLSLVMLLAFSFTSKAQTGHFGHYFIHTSTALNNDGYDGTILDDAAINSDSSKICIFTPLFGIYNKFNLGLYYNTPKWEIYQENTDTIPNNSMYNVMSPTANGTLFVHTTTVANTTTNYSLIDNPATNNNPNAVLMVSHCYNPLGASSNYYNKVFGVWYSTFANKWAVYNENQSPLANGITLNVFVASPGTYAYVHTITNANTSGTHVTNLDNPLLNGNPNATIFAVHNYGPGFKYDTSAIGVWYDGANWTVYNQKITDTLVNGGAFNIIIASTSVSGIEEVKPNIYNMAVYPNPSSSSSNIRYNLIMEGTVDIKLFNSMGEEISSIYSGKQSPGVYALPIDMQTLPQGVYFCRLSVDGKMTTQAITKQ